MKNKMKKQKKGKEPFRLDGERSRHGLCPWTARTRKHPASSRSTMPLSPSFFFFFSVSI